MRTFNRVETKTRSTKRSISTLSFPQFCFPSNHLFRSSYSEHFVLAEQNRPLFVERAQNPGRNRRKKRTKIFPDGERDNCSRSNRLIYSTSASTKLPPDELEPLSFQSNPPVNLRSPSPFPPIPFDYRYLKRGHKSCKWRRPTHGDGFIN